MNGSSASVNGVNGFHGATDSHVHQPVASTSAHVPLYSGSAIDKTEFVKLTLQALEDIGYSTTASALATESGVHLESGPTAELRNAVLQGHWDRVIPLLQILCPDHHSDHADLVAIAYLLGEQKYLEALRAKRIKQALAVLRSELATLHGDSDRLHFLSSLMMCSDLDELQKRAEWLGSVEETRLRCLGRLQEHIPTSVMMPSRRLETLLLQAQAHQRNECAFHTSDAPFSLLEDHSCPRSAFPNTSNIVLAGHSDEVWTIAWSPDGGYLATASADQTVIIWDLRDLSKPSVKHILKGHNDGVSCLAWSPDGKVLVSSAESNIKLWNTSTGELKGTVHPGHLHSVTAIAFLSSESFMSAGMDNCMFFWDMEGKALSRWKTGPYRIVGATITPDGKKLVAVGQAEIALPADIGNGIDGDTSALIRTERRLQIYDLVKRCEESFISQQREMTCVTVSADSKFALVSQAPNELRLYRLEDAQLIQRYIGQKQGNHVIMNCFGGPHQSFVASGSEDSNIYVWRKETGALVETLLGHTRGSVNAVAWCPSNTELFASAGDDHTVRIWRPAAECMEPLREFGSSRPS